MKRSWKIFSLVGIPVRLHFSMLIIPLLTFTLDFGPVPFWLSLFLGLALAVLLFGSVVLHELGHALMGRRFGVHTADIILTPIGGIARMSHIPETARPEIAIALAGPATSLLIALSAFGLSHLALPLPVLNAIWMEVLVLLAQLNLMLALFNLLPAFPMDGGRVLRGALNARFGFFKATAVTAQIGKWIAMAMGIYALFNSHWNLVFIAVFIYFAASQEQRMAAWRAQQAAEAQRQQQVQAVWGASPTGVKVVEATKVTVVEK
ncbi:MAG: site-2 protease family protein [Proteobacteria bacterium]|jgi:Zn-dependent protease|nr:site-2 protease family protein [Pseudomonadota bacterium]NLN61982.1 site-2 protease family protein [Myxococcales bacterium]